MKCILNIIFKLLRSNWLYYLAMLMITSSMLRSAIDKTLNFGLAVEEMHEHNLLPAVFFAALTIFVQFAGSFLIIFGRRFAWIGSGALVVFTLLTIMVVHDFWNMTGVDYAIHFKVVQNHLILMGGLILSGIASVAKYNSETLCSMSCKKS